MGRDTSEALIGGCSLAIEAPARFYRTFLDTPETPDPEFLARLIDQIVRGVLEDFLGDLFDGVDPAAPAEIQSRLTRLTPGGSDRRPGPLRPGLREPGPLYRRSAGGRMISQGSSVEETAGHLDGVRHN